RDSHLKPPPGATRTAVPLALPGSGKKGVRVAAVILCAMGSPHWRNQVSEAGWIFTPPVPRGIAWGSSGVSSGYLVLSLARAEFVNRNNEQTAAVLVTYRNKL